jgi:dCMP deaminase
MNTRPEKDYTFMQMSMVLSEQSTCIRRKVGCILVDRHNHIISEGYNGNAAGLPHCIESPCAGAYLPHGEGLHVCEAIHAEQNALIKCRDPKEVWICYVTTSPCMHCLKMLLNTDCKYIIYNEPYSDAKSVHELWARAGRSIKQIDIHKMYIY